MKALELLKSQTPLLLENETHGKKTKVLASSLNQLMLEMNNQIISFQAYSNSVLNGELSNKIIIAKSLAEFFAGNKLLKVDLVAENLRNQEKAKINEFYLVKTKLLDTIRMLIKETSKEAAVSNFDIFEGNFVKCEIGHEIIILGDRNKNVLKTLLKELDEQLTIYGNFDKIVTQTVDFNLSTLNKNIELCRRKANEIYGAKPSKLNKIEAFISKLEETGKQVVAFHTYKEALIEIGCNEKNVNAYEHELKKIYIPLKKTLAKELKIEIEYISNVAVNEEEYPTLNVDEPIQAFDSIFENNTTIVYQDNLVDNSLFTTQIQQTPTTVAEENPANPFVNPTNEQANYSTSENNNNNAFNSIFEPNNTNQANPFTNNPFNTDNNDNRF